MLSQLGEDALLLEPRQILDEDLAVEVIDLVLYTYREQTLGLERERLALRRSARGPSRARRARTFSKTPGTERQPSSVSASPLASTISGFTKTLKLVACFRDVDDDHALVDVDLRRGEPDARRGIHGLGHVLD